MLRPQLYILIYTVLISLAFDAHAFAIDVPAGYALYKHFGDFWRATQYWKLEPSDKLVDHGWCMAQPGREYVVYQNEAQPFTLKISGAKSALKAAWFNPLTGERTAAGALNSGTATLTPPANWGSTPLVLHVTAAN